MAKAIADGYLQRSGLDYTIVRPGRLTDDEPTGQIRIGPDPGSGSITRGDVATIVTAALRNPGTVERTFEVVNGDVAIEETLGGLGET